MINLTQELAGFANYPPFSEAPESAARIIRNGIIDTVATMIAGRNEPVVRIVRQHVEARYSNAPESSVLMGAQRVPAQDAALINGTAAHTVEVDDIYRGGLERA